MTAKKERFQAFLEWEGGGELINSIFFLAALPRNFLKMLTFNPYILVRYRNDCPMILLFRPLCMGNKALMCFHRSCFGGFNLWSQLGNLLSSYRSQTFCFQELSILQDLNDVRGECKAHANLGAVHLSLSNYINAIKCFQVKISVLKLPNV